MNVAFRLAKLEDVSDIIKLCNLVFENLKDTLDYIKHLRNMTKNYVQNAQNLFDSVKSGITIRF